MTGQPDNSPSGARPLAGAARLVAGIAVLLIAGLAILLALDAISLAVFGEFARKVLLSASIVILAGIAIGLLARAGGR